VDDTSVRLDLVRARDDHDVFDDAPPERGEDVRQEESLLRRAEARRLAGGEHDRGYDV